jgi:hypothetical protein
VPRLLKRVFDIDTERCPNCGAGGLKIIAALLERPVIEKIHSHRLGAGRATVRSGARRVGLSLKAPCLAGMDGRDP